MKPSWPTIDFSLKLDSLYRGDYEEVLDNGAAEVQITITAADEPAEEEDEQEIKPQEEEQEPEPSSKEQEPEPSSKVLEYRMEKTKTNQEVLESIAKDQDEDQ